MDRMGISLSNGQSAEFYYELCNFLIAKDAYTYVNLIRTKYELLKDRVCLQTCEYLIMEILLERFESKYPLVLSSLVYVVKYKS